MAILRAYHKLIAVFCFIYPRILGTPNEENWPGVRQLPDYKPTFPQWSRQDLEAIVPQLDDAGIDILVVSSQSDVVVHHVSELCRDSFC